jgi:PIN domain nuclease of toxin-antitoxin system
MSYLLDTHVLLWMLQGSHRLGARTRKILAGPGAVNWVSAASAWEISIKSALGRLQLAGDLANSLPDVLRRGGFRSLSITTEHALAVRALPPHHADPFDRMLVAQALCENLILVSADAHMAAYPVRTLDATL